MSNVPLHSPAKTAGPAKSPSQDAESTADSTVTDAIEPPPAKLPVWRIALGALSAVLLVFLAVSRIQLSHRDESLVQGKNHAEQAQDAFDALKVQLDTVKADMVRLQKKMDETEVESEQGKLTSAKEKIEAAERQSQLEKSRATTTDFRKQMADAQVAAINYEGKTEVALAQAAVMKTQWTAAQAETAQLQTYLTEARAASDAWQAKSEKAEKEIERLQRIPGRK